MLKPMCSRPACRKPDVIRRQYSCCWSIAGPRSDPPERRLEDLAEHVEQIHVEADVQQTGVQEAGRDQAPVLVLLVDRGTEIGPARAPARGSGRARRADTC